MTGSKYTINVTQENIDNGSRGDCKLCPIALAIAPLGLRGFVEMTSISVIVNEEKTIYTPLPSIATAFIWGFDSGEPVSPFSFEIEVPNA